MNLLLLEDFVIIFGLATLVIFFFHKYRIPAIVGFLITGVLTGPHGFGLVQNHEDIEILAEIGVILLLFTIGIEFSLKTLIRIRRTVFLGGSLQVLLTVVFAFGIFILLGNDVNQSIFMGFLAALSSTAVVLRVLQEKGEVSSQYGQTSTGILIFQDIAIVPMILLTPLLAGANDNSLPQFLWILAKAIITIILALASARYLIPKLLHQIAKTQSQELFLLTIFVIVFAVAWLTSAVGLSLALGAFLAGLIISESDYSHEAFGNIIPFRDIFTSFFFVSIGMLLDVRYIIQNPMLVIIVSLGVIALKTFLNGFVAFILGLPFRTTVLIGLVLSQVGEFSFILSKDGLAYDLISDDYYQLFLAVAVISMALAPMIINLSPKLADMADRLPLPQKYKRGKQYVIETPVPKERDHLLIIGLGVHGFHLIKAARHAGIRFIGVDNDPETVRDAQKDHIPVVYGDGSNEIVLEQAGAQRAEVVVVSVGEPAAIFRITELVRKKNPTCYLIVRTRYISDIEELYNRGASEVIPEEFETSVEIFAKVLNKYLIPRDDIEKLIGAMRTDSYEMFRTVDKGTSDIKSTQLQFPNTEVSALKVTQDSHVVNKSLTDLDLRKTYGVTLLAVKRGRETVPNPSPDELLEVDDILYVMGEPSQIACVNHLLTEQDEPEC